VLDNKTGVLNNVSQKIHTFVPPASTPPSPISASASPGLLPRRNHQSASANQALSFVVVKDRNCNSFRSN
jgi:hypothetical protein